MQNLRLEKILPAVTLERVTDAVPVAEAIRSGGLTVLEITFRTGAAAEAIKIISKNIPGMYVGAGTILTKEDLHSAKAAGAQFGLAPGFNPTIVKEAFRIGLPFIPGVMTPSEIESALELGCKVLKLFPAMQVGGIGMLKALSGPYGHTDARFIPMGGVNLQNMNDYLKLDNVISVGGSWLATKNLIDNGDYTTIERNTSDALEMATKNH